MRVACALFLLATAVPAPADVKVKMSAGQMSVQAQNAPIGEILQRIADKTGMKVIWDGPRPQEPVKVTLADRSPLDAVLGVLEGRGINFAVVLDPTGSSVETLFLSTVPVKLRRPPPPPEPQVVPGDAETGMEAPPPIPPALDPATAGQERPAPPAPTAAPAAATPVPITLPTPPPPSVSPFTPQGPGPIILNLPGVTPIPPS
jgi:hypothetical protein